MSLLSARALTKQYGAQLCFRDAEFTLAEGARVGLIGANGAGKTTIFRIILGEIDFEGTLERRRDLRIAALDQDPRFPPEATVREALLGSDPEIARLEAGIREIHEKLEAQSRDPEATEKLLARLAQAETRFEHLGGYDLERQAELILEGTGFPRELRSRIVASLSGGERSRVAFARLLMAKPDLWLLDEPTNHLDIDGILFLETFLKESQASAIIISHDRRFLDQVTTETWEIEGQRLFRYPAPYSRARELRGERLKSAWREFDKQQDHLEKESEFIRRYGAGQRARQAQGRLKRLDRLERLERPEDRIRAMSLRLSAGERPAHRVLALRDLAGGYGESRLFRGLTLELERGETLGIAGPNGAGKTTLLGLLLGSQAPLEGSVRWGERVHPGHLSQHESLPDPATTPYRFLREAAPKRTEQELRDLLAAMLFPGDTIDKPVSVLSGGERKRLMLVRLLVEGNNVLLLDEPTNHLDLPSREALELALARYEGTLILVSHDRYFIDQVADRVLWLESGEWHLSTGGFAEALTRRRKRKEEAARVALPDRPPAAPRTSSKAAPAPKTASPWSKLKTGELEERIIACEERIRSLEAEFSRPEVLRNPARVKECHGELEDARRELASLEAEYANRRS